MLLLLLPGVWKAEAPVVFAGVPKPGVEAGVFWILDLGLEKGVMGDDNSYLSNHSFENFVGTGLAALEATGAL